VTSLPAAVAWPSVFDIGSSVDLDSQKRAISMAWLIHATRKPTICGFVTESRGKQASSKRRPQLPAFLSSSLCLLVALSLSAHLLLTCSLPLQRDPHLSLTRFSLSPTSVFSPTPSCLLQRVLQLEIFSLSHLRVLGSDKSPAAGELQATSSRPPHPVLTVVELQELAASVSPLRTRRLHIGR
jgi:hypothetical protein